MEQDYKELELALQQSEEQYRWLFTQMQQPVSVHDIVEDEHGKVVDYVFVDGNLSLERLLKLSMAELKGKSIRAVNPHVSAETVEAVGRVALTGEPLVQDYYSARTGRDFQIVSYSPHRGRFVSIHTDVTDWKRAEASLREANRILHALNTYSLEQAGCRTSHEFIELVTKQLEEYAKPVAVTFNAYGTPILELREGQAAPPAAFLEPFAHAASVSLRRIQAEEKLRHMSLHDQLTGLYNRHFLELEMNRIDSAENLPLSVIMADLNGLKAVNDTYGHLQGDGVLLVVAAAIREGCRTGDVVVRWGGDEFLVLLPNTSAETAEGICRSIAEKCRAAQVGEVPVTVALGAASKTSVDQLLTTVMREAEDAMHKNKLAESSSARSSVLGALLKVLEEKSYETQAHTSRMQEVALKIGKRCRLSASELHRLMLVIMLHDIGKINIPEEMLTRTGPLSDAEWKVMKQHPEVGGRIARAMPDFAHVADDILAHHERWDGKGYPQGLQGEGIPLLARITCIADAYEVMSNGRPYKTALSPDEIIAELKRGAGTQFDPALVGVFLASSKMKNLKGVQNEDPCHRRVRVHRFAHLRRAREKRPHRSHRRQLI